MASLLTFDKNQILSKAFFESQFKYCSLTRMFCDRGADNGINKLHLITAHHTQIFIINIQIFLLEIYKIKHNLCGSCLNVLFSAVNCNCDLCSHSDFRDPGINTVFLRCQFNYISDME